MKKNKNFAFGFTIAELLITMLITTVVAAAMVPVIGLKKVKSPRNIYNHGVAECYYEPTGYDANGDATGWQLMFLYADSGQRKDAVPQAVNGSYCTFEVPTADFIEITAVGAGTDGYVMVPDFGSFQTTTSGAKSGFISVDSQYRSKIAEAKVSGAEGEEIPIGEYLLKLISEWSNSSRANELYADYFFDSPIGKGGDGKCQTFTRTVYAVGCDCTVLGNDDDEQCSGPGGDFYTENYDAFMASGPKCWAFLHGRGQDSARGGSTNNVLHVPLTADTFITANTSESVTSMQVTGAVTYNIKLGASTAGSDAQRLGYNNLGYVTNFSTENMKDATCEPSGICALLGFRWDENMINKGATMGPKNSTTKSCGYSKPGETAKKGVIYYSSSKQNKDTNPDKLKWVYNSVVARPTFGTSGNFGKESTIVYENIKGKLYMIPAPYVSGENNNVTYVRASLNDNNTTLVSAASGGSAGSRQTSSFSIVTSDMPIPEKPYKLGRADNKDRFGYVAKVAASKVNSGLKTCESTMTCPGYAGNGQYFYITDLPDAVSLSLTNLYNGATYTMPTERILQENSVDIANPECDDGTTPIALPKVGSVTPKYCQEKKTKGSPGAVIIIW